MIKSSLHCVTNKSLSRNVYLQICKLHFQGTFKAAGDHSANMEQSRCSRETFFHFNPLALI